MEVLGHLFDGFLISFEPLNLFLIFIGVVLGLFIVAMPGLGSVNGVSIFLPATFLVPPTSSMIFLAAIYYGAMYGGAISSITLGIPGASTAVATTFDGRPLALKGRAQHVERAHHIRFDDFARVLIAVRNRDQGTEVKHDLNTADGSHHRLRVAQIAAYDFQLGLYVI